MHLAPLLLIGYVADALLGDPEHWPHPVRALGGFIGRFERLHYEDSVAAGLGLVLATVSVTLAAPVLAFALLPGPLAWLLAAYLVYACLAAQGLDAAGRRVLAALEEHDMAAARRAVGRLVGRDTAGLDAAGVRRACLESLAENLSDGVAAPLFWGLVLGAPGMLLYKAVNTMDSMVGYTAPRYARFGRVAARLDDAVNYIPARLTAWLLVAAARLTRPEGLQAARRARRVLRADAAKSKSPNAGRPMAAMAGALGVRLGGPASYFGENEQKPWLGGAGREPGDADLEAGLRLARLAGLGMLGLVLFAAWLLDLELWGLAGTLT